MTCEIRCNYFKTKHGDDARLHTTGTNSPACEIKTADFYKDVNSDVKKLTLVTTQIIIRLKIKAELICKVLGNFKDDADGKQIV